MTKLRRHEEIARQIRGAILSGALKPQTKLKPRRDLMVEHKTSRHTIDRAIALLESEGLVTSEPRMHVTVRDISERGTTLGDRVAAHKATGRALAENEHSEIFETGLVGCPANVAVKLGVDEGTSVLCRGRVTFRDGQPVGLSRSYYARDVADLVPELTEKTSIPAGSRELAAERMGSEQASAVQEVIARHARAEEVSKLNLGSLEVAVSEVTRVTYLRDGRVVEVGVKVTDGKRPLMFWSTH